ncbi:MAG: amidase [Actinomycetota bacterium]
MTELHELDATALAAAIAAGQVSAVEAVDAAITRIEQLNPVLNAVIWTDFEAARAAAAVVDSDASVNGPFRGVPFLIKDIGATQAGLPAWLGNRALKAMGHRRATDTELGARFRSAGLITVGKTNLPELGSSPTTQPLSCGPTANPWDLERSPAGSSGGAGSAVAAGMVPMAHANDGGGSTRLPAAWCGLVGLKTTRGRVPNPESTSRLVSELVVTRTVRDTAGLLDAVLGPTESDLYREAPPDAPYGSTLLDELPPLRIGMLTDGGYWPVDPDCVAAVEATATLLESLGHLIEPVSSEILLGEASAVNGRLWTSDLAMGVAGLGEMAGRPMTEADVEPYNWTAAERGVALSAMDRAAAIDAQQQWVNDVARWFTPLDVLLTPTSAAAPMRTADLWPPEEKPWKIGPVYGKIGAFTLPFNVTGQPAISLPLHWNDDGLPIGTQLVAKMGGEDLLLGLAARLEQAAPWAGRYPAPSAPKNG